MKKDIPYLLLLILSSFIFVFDLFFVKGRPASFDEIVHVTNIEQFSQSFRQGEFPVYWLGKFANYGMPVPIIAQQTNNYIGGFINIFANNPVFSYNLVVFFGICLSSLFY